VSKILLLEIGVEELPPLAVGKTLTQLKAQGQKLFDASRISYERVSSFGSSRRLVFWVEGVAGNQRDRTEKEMGPPRSVALTQNGQLTPEGRAYLRAKRAKKEDLGIEELTKGDYVYLKRTIKGEKTKKILPHLLAQLIKSLSFPKSMRWGEGDFSFGRPIRSLMALFGEDVIPLEVASVPSDRKTRGHPYLSPFTFSIRNPREYFSELKKRYVIVDQEERRKLILKQTEDMISHLRENHPQAKILGDEELLEEVVYLVEYPTPFLGEFDRQFLSLPVPVLRACLRDYQKHFSLADGDRILPYFVGIREGNRDHLDEVVDGNRRVLNARLTDAQFFFSEDTKKIFDTARVSELKEIVVQEKLGSYYDKAKRLAQISDKIVSRITKTKKEKNELYPRVSEAAWLCKLDLTTQMVKEFPSLQGTMGAEYARRSGKDARVAQAVSEHRLPRFSNDKLPETLEGAILALADKMDTVVGSFWAGFIPSGSEDPWGLRRDAQGIVEIIVDRGWRIDLDGLLEEVLALYTENDKDIVPRIRDFFESRIRNVLKEKGIGIRETNAILSIGFADITDALRRAEALGNISRRREFKDQVIAIVRLVNMLKQAQQWKVPIPQVVREDLLREKEEKELYELRTKLEGKIESLLDEQKYVEAYQELSRFEESIHDFFDRVLVMSEEESLRKNRLSLLNGIGKFFNRIADFTQLQVK